MEPGHSDTAVHLGEEIANGITHGFGLLLSVAGLTILVTLAALRGNAWHVVACSVYGATLVLLYLASTLYHSIHSPGAKRILRILDHSAIYLLIAGTYTPFVLVTLRNLLGWTLFGIVWTLAALGIVFKSFAVEKFAVASTVLYALMGWLGIVGIKAMYVALSWGGLAWILAGGAFYTLGILFFASKRRYFHTIWHLFVIAGSLCHFFAVLFYVIPRR